MQDTVVQQLIDLNSKFYQTFALPFSSTRMRIQPGVRRILGQVKGDEKILDLGCGNGETYFALNNLGFHGYYVGIDSNDTFLRIAQEKHQMERKQEKNAVFIKADLTKPGWLAQLPPIHYDLIFAFATLHHIPSQPLRNLLFHQIYQQISKNLEFVEAHFIHSEWQFLNNPRLLSKIVPWNTIGLSEDEIDPGDYLIDWRHEGYGIRYVHHFTKNELEQLAYANYFCIIDEFFSDGEGKNLSLYQTWIPEKHKSG